MTAKRPRGSRPRATRVVRRERAAKIRRVAGRDGAREGVVRRVLAARLREGVPGVGDERPGHLAASVAVQGLAVGDRALERLLGRRVRARPEALGPRRGRGVLEPLHEFRLELQDDRELFGLADGRRDGGDGRVDSERLERREQAGQMARVRRVLEGRELGLDGRERLGDVPRGAQLGHVLAAERQ